MMPAKDARSTIRFASVMIAWCIVTLSYYSFHHYVHHRRFHFTPSHGSSTNNGTAMDDKKGSSGMGETHAEHGQRLLLEGYVVDEEVDTTVGVNNSLVQEGPPTQKAHEQHEHGDHEGKVNDNDEAQQHHDVSASGAHGSSSSSSSSAHGHGHGGHGCCNRFNGKDNLFFYGLAFPLVLLTVAGLIWGKNKVSHGPSKTISRDIDLKTISDLQLVDTSSDTGSSSSDSDSGSTGGDGITRDTVLATRDNPQGQNTLAKKTRNWLATKNNNGGDINVKKWTILWFLLPAFLITFDGMRARNILHASEDQKERGANLYMRVCGSLLSPSGYAAAWPLALFLVPVTKHSPVLDWMRVTPVQALGYHRICGWVSFWWSCAHGFLHLQHSMGGGNSGERAAWTFLRKLKYQLIPEEVGKCFATQNPWRVLFGEEEIPYESHQCHVALVNGTGMVSCIAFAILAITSVPYFRRNFYTLFYMVHIPMAWIMLINAIWHYSMCALLLIPNIIYYLSFNIPVCATQGVERLIQLQNDRQNKKTSRDVKDAEKSSALVQVNLIEGGSIELTFATTPNEQRHENCYVRVYCPGVSFKSHPFSIFSRRDLESNTKNVDEGSTTLATRSILLRAKGPFTDELTKFLFPNRAAEGATESTLVSTNPSSEEMPSMHHKIQFDSFYAGSFDWVDRAMESHDTIMILAGGVGIVPFLEFLPALQRRIVSARQCDRTLESIDLHWYCREVGLASHVLNNYLKPHVQEAWESDPACRGMLKIRVHLTKSPEGEEALKNISNSGLVENRNYAVGDGESQQAAIHLVQDARFTQSLGLRLGLPGILMVAGTLGHWWWYEQFIKAESLGRNLLVRSHSIMFSLVLAVTLSALVEVYFRFYKNKAGYSLVNGNQEDATASERGATAEEDKEGQDGFMIEMTTSDDAKLEMEMAVPLEASLLSRATTNVASSNFLKVSGGRPTVDAVIQDILEASHPGVYSCGPRALLDMVEGSIRHKRDDCAFYEEDSEM